MRKLIIGIALLLVAVLCLSNLSRISDAAFDKFFEDDSTLNSDSGSSDNGDSSNGGSSSGGTSDGSSSDDNGSSDGNVSGDNEETPKIETGNFKLCTDALFVGNPRIITSSVYFSSSSTEDVYFYKVDKKAGYGYDSRDYYVKVPGILDVSTVYLLEADSPIYIVGEAGCSSDGNMSTVLDLYSLDEYFDLKFFHISEDISGGMVFKLENCYMYTRGEYTYIFPLQTVLSSWSYFCLKVKSEDVDYTCNAFSTNLNCCFYGLTTSPGEDASTTSEVNFINVD